jgi:hypothetical protein
MYLEQSELKVSALLHFLTLQVVHPVAQLGLLLLRLQVTPPGRSPCLAQGDTVILTENDSYGSKITVQSNGLSNGRQ